MDEAKIKEVLSDKEYVKELLAMDSEKQVQASLEEKGVELSLDEIRRIGEVADKVVKGEISQDAAKRMADGELTEDELEAVAGGFEPATLIAGCIVGAIVIAIGISWLVRSW